MFNVRKSIPIFLVFISGLFLIYLSVYKIDAAQLLQTIGRGNYLIAFPVFCISLIGYWVRSKRWKLLLESMGSKPQTGHLFVSLSIGYAVNFATPRLGEIVRCLVLKKINQTPVTQSGISVVLERIIDLVSLLVIVLLALLLNVNTSSGFIAQQIIAPVWQKLHTIPIGYPVLFLVLGVWFCVWIYRKKQLNEKGTALLDQLVTSCIKLMHLQQKGLFVLYTILIWGCYFLMTYLWFYTFPETQHLGFGAAFVMMAVGSIGRSVPIQGGGMGAYHYLVSNAFVIFGISLLMGNAMAFIIHGAQMVLTILLGMCCWIWLLIYSQKQK